MKRRDSFFRESCGSATVMFAILMFAFVGLMVFVIDLAHLQNVKTELSNAADACALRGARAFLPDNIVVTNDQLTQVVPNRDQAKSQASLAIGDNRSDDNTFRVAKLTDLPTDDIQVGIWDYEAKQLLDWDWPPPSSMWGTYIGPGISLPVKRDDGRNQGKVRMTLAQIFNILQVRETNQEVGVTARATAALSGVGGYIPGSPVLPFGTWDDTLQNVGVNGSLHGTFNRDNTDTMGFSNLNPKDLTPNANILKQIMVEGALYDCPYGSTVGMINGQLDSVLQAMTQQPDKKNTINRFGLVDPDGDGIYVPSNEINTAVTNEDGSHPTFADTVYMMPVYAGGLEAGDKYTQSAVVGGVPIKIVSVNPKGSNKYIDVQVVGGGQWAVNGYGGGRWYGILATEPKLVGKDQVGY